MKHFYDLCFCICTINKKHRNWLSQLWAWFFNIGDAETYSYTLTLKVRHRSCLRGQVVVLENGCEFVVVDRDPIRPDAEAYFTKAAVEGFDHIKIKSMTELLVPVQFAKAGVLCVIANPFVERSVTPHG